MNLPPALWNFKSAAPERQIACFGLVPGRAKYSGDAAMGAPPASSADQVYAYKPSLAGAAIEFRLTTTALQWSRGRRVDRIPYDRVRRLRLSFRPVTMQSHRFLAEIWSRDGAKLQIASTSWRSLLEQERLDAAYGAFVTELSRRIAAAGPPVSFETGSPVLVYWVGIAAFAAVSFGLAGLTVRALQAGALAAGAMIGGFFAVLLWQGGTFFRRNQPGTYRPDAIPPTVLPG
jgi:hypothetical protein